MGQVFTRIRHQLGLTQEISGRCKLVGQHPGGHRTVDLSKNVWDVFKDEKALGGIALGAPGDSNFDTNIPLVFKLPVAVKAGEAAKWKMWARLNRTADPNSFFWRVSQDTEKWKPGAFNIDTHGWNNPAATVPAKTPWFWFDGVGSPDFEEGDNYISVAARESGVPPNVNLIDVIMIRNDGQKPTDEEAEKLLAEQYAGVESPLGEAGEGLKEDQAVTPGGKLTITWGHLKDQ